MKQGVHPNYNNDVKVTCACGNTFSTGSVSESIRVEICYACHPFFTGTQKFVDTLGQVDKFQKKTQVSQAKAEEKKQIRQARAERTSVDKSEKPSLKDLLMQARKNLNS